MMPVYVHRFAENQSLWLSVRFLLWINNYDTKQSPLFTVVLCSNLDPSPYLNQIYSFSSLLSYLKPKTTWTQALVLIPPSSFKEFVYGFNQYDSPFIQRQILYDNKPIRLLNCTGVNSVHSRSRFI